MSGCIAEVKDDKIVPIPSEYDPVLNKLVKKYYLCSKSKGATSTNSDTEEKVIGHIEKVKCEQDVKLSIAKQYKEDSQRQCSSHPVVKISTAASLSKSQINVSKVVSSSKKR